jgi:hypothetical protein
MYRLLSNISSQQAKGRWIMTTVKLATLEMVLPTLAAVEDSSTDPARSGTTGSRHLDEWPVSMRKLFILPCGSTRRSGTT